MDTRRYLTKEQKADIARQIMDIVRTGVSRSRAAEIIYGVRFQQVERWGYSDKTIWEILNDNPYPHEPTITNRKVIPWAVAAKHLRDRKSTRLNSSH